MWSHLTHVREHLNAGLHRGLLDRVEPGAVEDPEDALEQLDKHRLAGLRATTGT